MKICFSKSVDVDAAFYPFTFFRNVEDILSGLYSNKERWQKIIATYFDQQVEFTSKELAEVLIDPCVVPTQKLVKSLLTSDANICWNGQKIIERKGEKEEEECEENLFSYYSKIDLVQALPQLIVYDNTFFISKNTSSSLNFDDFTKVYNSSSCYIGKNTKIRNATLNAEQGPIIIMEGAEVMEYAVIYGPVVIHKNAKVGPHSFVRSGTVIGRNSYVLGELKNVLILPNSNKGHVGYLGDTIVGEFCNLGAGTTTSNMKNNFSEVNIYDSKTGTVVSSKEMKVGSFIGDFSMTAVNTVLVAGTTVGIMANVFGELIYPKHIPSFSWKVNEVYKEDKYKKIATTLLMHKGIELEEINNLIGKLEACYIDLVKNK